MWNKTCAVKNPRPLLLRLYDSMNNMKSLSQSKTKEIVSNIRGIREMKAYTQDYLAAKLGISQNAYSKIELGYSSITLSRLIEISEILEVELTELVCPDRAESLQLN